MLDATTYASSTFQRNIKNMFNDLKQNPSVDDAYRVIRYNIWHSLNSTQRDVVIKPSNIPCIGGYYDYDDANLDALLRKVIPTTTIIKMVA